MSKKINILHFDDEFLRVQWIPTSLQTEILVRFPEKKVGLVRKCNNPADQVRLFCFEIDEILVEYHFCFDQNAFSGEYDKLKDDDGLIVILDLMAPEGDSVKCTGNDLYWKVEEKHSQRAIFLTAYPHEIKQDIRKKLRPGQIFSKPPQGALITAMVDLLGQCLNNGGVL